MGDLSKGWCFVLSGGGAKGVFHMGVWQALNELGIEVDAFVGTSIGALAAAAMAQGSDDALESLVRNLSLESMVALPPELLDRGRLRLSNVNLESATTFLAHLIRRQGLDTSPLRRVLQDHIDENRLRQSGKDWGLVTINLSDLSPRELFLDQMEPGTLIDYLMATSAFPGFEAPRIHGKRYLDGGLWDNIPYDMARRRGYRRIIVSDVSGLGVNRKVELAGSITTYVRNSLKMGSVFDFDPKFLKDYRTLGYLDALRAFGELGGEFYFLEPSDHSVPAFLEDAALALEVPRVARYTSDELASVVMTAKDQVDRDVDIWAQGEAGKRLRRLLKTSESVLGLEGGPYRRWRVLEVLAPGRTGQALRTALQGLYPGLPEALEYFRKSGVSRLPQ